MHGKSYFLVTKLQPEFLFIFTDWLDNGNNKRALQEADKVLKKQPNFLCAKVNAVIKDSIVPVINPGGWAELKSCPVNNTLSSLMLILLAKWLVCYGANNIKLVLQDTIFLLIL